MGSNPSGPIFELKAMKLVLFDVDGILISSYAFEKCDYWKESIKKHFGLDISKKDIYMQGKTDRQIFVELLELKGIMEPERDERFILMIRDFGNVVREAIRNHEAELIPGVENLLKSLQKEKCIIGLLTGNTYEKAKVKLEKAGLWEHFKVGAFGSETRKRSELVPLALKDAREKTGIDFRKEDVFLIGDTVRDIQCAKEGGVNSIAVSTGKESYEQLKREHPDYLFKDFSNPDKIIDAIMKTGI